MSKNDEKVSGKYFWAIMYPENMVEDWQERICEIIQKPFAYCIHDKDLEREERKEERKKHVHIIIAWNNNTTINAATKLFQKLNAPGKQAIAFGGVIEKCDDINFCYNYLIHDSDDARKKKKYQYEKKERITGNNFDIGAYVQITTHDKISMTKELCDVILEHNVLNYIEFYKIVISNFDDSYFEILTSNTTLFRELIKGNYHYKIHADE